MRAVLHAILNGFPIGQHGLFQIELYGWGVADIDPPARRFLMHGEGFGSAQRQARGWDVGRFALPRPRPMSFDRMIENVGQSSLEHDSQPWRKVINAFGCDYGLGGHLPGSSGNP